MPSEPTRLPGILPGYSGAPGSLGHLELRKEYGWRGSVLRLRFNGVYLPVQILRNRPIVTGLIVSQLDHPRWNLDVFNAGDASTELLHTLYDPTIGKQREDGSSIIHGTEWDEGYLQRWPQTWLIGPKAEGVKADAEAMSGWLRSKYTGKLTIM